MISFIVICYFIKVLFHVATQSSSNYQIKVRVMLRTFTIFHLKHNVGFHGYNSVYGWVNDWMGTEIDYLGDYDPQAGGHHLNLWEWNGFGWM